MITDLQRSSWKTNPSILSIYPPFCLSTFYSQLWFCFWTPLTIPSHYSVSDYHVSQLFCGLLWFHLPSSEKRLCGLQSPYFLELSNTRYIWQLLASQGNVCLNDRWTLLLLTQPFVIYVFHQAPEFQRFSILHFVQFFQHFCFPQFWIVPLDIIHKKEK